MACTPQEVEADLANLPDTAFSKASVEARNTFAEFVCSVDENARAKHDIRFYTGTARAMAELVNGVQTEDFADEFIRDTLRAGLKVGDKPFHEDGWADFALTPAMIALALRCQKRCEFPLRTSFTGPVCDAKRAEGNPLATIVALVGVLH